MTYKDVIFAWNIRADQFNQWEELSEEEKIEFALSQAAATPENNTCPICGCIEKVGHAPDCKLSAALRKYIK